MAFGTGLLLFAQLFLVRYDKAVDWTQSLSLYVFLFFLKILINCVSWVNCRNQVDIAISGLNSKIIHDGDHFLITYSCSSLKIKQIVGFHLYVYDKNISEDGELLMSRNWDCYDDSKVWSNTNRIDHHASKPNKEQIKSENSEFMRMQIKLPITYVYRPDILQRSYSYKYKLKLRAWIIDSFSFIRFSKLQSQVDLVYNAASYKKELSYSLELPYSRKSRQEEECLHFFSQIRERIDSKRIYKCPIEQGMKSRSRNLF